MRGLLSWLSSLVFECLSFILICIESPCGLIELHGWALFLHHWCCWRPPWPLIRVVAATAEERCCMDLHYRRGNGAPLVSPRRVMVSVVDHCRLCRLLRGKGVVAVCIAAVEVMAYCKVALSSHRLGRHWSSATASYGVCWAVFMQRRRQSSWLPLVCSEKGLRLLLSREKRRHG